MKNLILAISNNLDNNKIITEDKLDKVLNDATITIEEKISQVEYLLREVALADISMNLWRSYTTPPEGAQQGEEVEPQGPEEKPAE